MPRLIFKFSKSLLSPYFKVYLKRQLYIKFLYVWPGSFRTFPNQVEFAEPESCRGIRNYFDSG